MTPLKETIIPDKQTTPKIAVIGCGGWGKNIVRTMHKLGYLVAVVDPSESGRNTASELCEGIQIFDDVSFVLPNENIDAIMIATPAETHYSIAKAALLAGKDVYVEKPMTIDIKEANELVSLAESCNQLLMVGHLLEYHPAVCKIEELIQQGVLGKVNYVVSNRLNLGKIRTEENVLWSFAPHDISVILRIMGKQPTEVVATGGAYVTDGIEDISLTQLSFDDNERAHIFTSWIHPYKEQKLIVIGDKKMVTYCDITKELLLHDQSVTWDDGIPIPVKGASEVVEFSSEMPLDIECQHFAHCVATKTPPRTDGKNGYRVLSVLQDAQKSMHLNGEPVRCQVTNFEDTKNVVR